MPVPAGSGLILPVDPLTLTYDPTLSRVRITAAGLSTIATYQVQRSLNGAVWTAVRGGQAVTTVGGGFTVDDYEFTPGVENHYRLVGPSGWDEFGRTIADEWGTADSGQVWANVPGQPAGGTAADFYVSGGAAHHRLPASGSMRSNLPITAGFLDLTVLTSIPVTPTGASLGAGVYFRSTDVSNQYVATAVVSTSSAVNAFIQKVDGGAFSTVANVAIPALTHTPGTGLWIRVQAANNMLRMMVWEDGDNPPDDWHAEGADSAFTSGALGVRSMVSAGNSNTPVVISYNHLAVTTPTAVTASASITPTIDKVWLKSLARPFLNRSVDIRDQGPISRSPRAGVFDIGGRTLPVAVSDLRRSKQWTLTLRAETPDEADDIDFLLASGDTLLIQAPATGPLSVVQGGYVTVGTTTRSWAVPFDPLRAIEMQCIEVAAPGPDVVGTTGTWQTVLNTYATCADVLLAHPTCADLLELVGSPGDVIVD